MRPKSLDVASAVANGCVHTITVRRSYAPLVGFLVVLGLVLGLLIKVS